MVCGKMVYVGGVPGAGKTTISSLVASGLNNCEYISSGEIKRPEARRRFGKGLSSLGQKESFVINRWFFNSLYDRNDKKGKLIDTHYTYPLSDSSFVRLFPEDCIGGIDLFILFEASARTVMDRRISRGRDRDSIDLDFVRVELRKERGEAFRLSDEFSVPLEVLSNNGEIDVTTYNFRGFLKKYGIV